MNSEPFKKWVLPALVTLLVLGIFIWRQQPAQVVKRRAEKILKIASLPDAVGPADLLFRVDAMRGLLAEDIEVRVAAFGYDEEARGKGEVLTAFQFYVKTMGPSDLRGRFGQIQIAGKRAMVPLAISGQIREADGTVENSEVQGRFEFVAEEAGWLLRMVEFVGE